MQDGGKILNKQTSREGSFGADKKLRKTESRAADMSGQNFIIFIEGVLESYLVLKKYASFKWSKLQEKVLLAPTKICGEQKAEEQICRCQIL
jgi:hypothetical protein